MCSLCQLLVATKQISSVQGQQEYALPDDLDEVENVVFWNGTLLRNIPVSQAQVQNGCQTQGIPVAFYLRFMTMQFMNQGANSDIAITEINPGARKPKRVIGLFPIPSMTGQNITVTYYQRHYPLQQSLDEFAIPDEFMRGVVAYAQAKGKEKESAYQEADKFMATFKDYSQRLSEKWQNQGQEVAFPRMKVRGLGGQDDYMGGSSWVYVGDAT